MALVICKNCAGVGGFLVPNKNNLTTGKGWVTCQVCKGSCHVEVDNRCTKCSGTGRMLKYSRLTQADQYVDCDGCNGKGTI